MGDEDTPLYRTIHEEMMSCFMTATSMEFRSGWRLSIFLLGEQWTDSLVAE